MGGGSWIRKDFEEYSKAHGRSVTASSVLGSLGSAQEKFVWSVGRQHNLRISYSFFPGVVFYLLVVFTGQLLAALISGSGDSGLTGAALDDCDLKMRAGQSTTSFACALRGFSMRFLTGNPDFLRASDLWEATQKAGKRVAGISQRRGSAGVPCT